MLIDYFTNAEIMRLTGAGRSTVYRWRQSGAPQTVLKLLEIIEGRDLGIIHPDWSGWGINFKTGELYTPTNDCFLTWQIISLPYLHGALNGYKQRERLAVNAVRLNQFVNVRGQ